MMRRMGLVLVGVAALAGCSGRTAGVTRDSTATAAERGTRDSISAEEHMRRLGVTIDSLAGRARGADRRLQAGIVEQIERLRTQRDSTARALDRLRASGREGWDKAKVGTDS